MQALKHDVELPVETRLPTRREAGVFFVKSRLLQLRRALDDTHRRVRRFPLSEPAEFPYIHAESRTPLWNEADGFERQLQRGKVQNLRCAARRLNRAVIPGGGLFSFWKQVGQATRRRGFVPGRLLREGCLMPAVGGGLCQLSNALYDVALQAGLEVVERWPHSRIIPGSAAEQGRDATVAWNYIDLRFRPAQAIMLEAVLTRDELIIRVRGQHAAKPSTPLIPLSTLTAPRSRLDAQAHSCGSCEQSRCFRHVPSSATQTDGETAFILNECWLEFREYVQEARETDDVLAVPLSNSLQKLLRLSSQRYAWNEEGFSQVRSTPTTALRRSLRARRSRYKGAARLQAQLQDDESLANGLAHILSPNVTRVVVAQSLLPFLWREGHLGGRSFDVLMTRLPLQELHQQLDAASESHPASCTLGEFRAPAWMVEAETAALTAATRIITPHAAIASLFPERAQRLRWHLPARPMQFQATASHVAFPGPTAARKGCYELRAAARQLGFTVGLSGSELEGENFWQECRIHRSTGHWLEGAALVVQPALIEENPRRLLEALAAGMPVIATDACGLEAQPGLTTVAAGDTDALISAIAAALSEHSLISSAHA